MTTALGARGLLAPRTPGSVSVVRSSEEVAAALITLLGNESAWREQQRSLVEHHERHLAPYRVQRELRHAIREVME